MDQSETIDEQKTDLIKHYQEWTAHQQKFIDQLENELTINKQLVANQKRYCLSLEVELSENKKLLKMLESYISHLKKPWWKKLIN
jgi:hypothetical protein